MLLILLADKIKPSPYGEKSVSLNYGLHFSGGEPFLNFDLLLKGVEIARKLDIPSTFVETNCYWCTNSEITRERLWLLKEKGLRGILISVNPFYLEYVPFEQTERAIRIAREVFGENVMIYQLEYYFRFKQLGIRDIITVDNYMDSDQGKWARDIEMFITGRAAYNFQHVYKKYPAAFFIKQFCHPPFIRSWHNHFDSYGNYLPGYCGGISLGNWPNINTFITEGLDIGERPVLGYLIKRDFKGLLKFAKSYGYQEPDEGYISKCHFCLDVRKYLVMQKDFEELQPREFYMDIEP
jgi:hypothetical protein